MLQAILIKPPRATTAKNSFHGTGSLSCNTQHVQIIVWSVDLSSRTYQELLTIYRRSTLNVPLHASTVNVSTLAPTYGNSVLAYCSPLEVAFQADKELSFDKKSLCDKHMVVLVLPYGVKTVLGLFYFYSNTIS